MQYGYQGNVSTGWRSQNDADADKLAHDMATQILVWETVIGERDAEFNHVDTGGKDTAKSCIAPGNPLYSRFCTYYDSMVASVKSHTVIPSFMARSSGKAQSVELAWNGSEYTATLTDTNNVLSKFTFSSDMAGLKFSVNGNKLTITSDHGNDYTAYDKGRADVLLYAEPTNSQPDRDHGRFFKLYMYTAIAPIPLSSFAGEPTQSIGKSFLKSYAAVCLEGAIIVLACIIFSIFAGSPPVVDPDAAAATMVWSYIGELIFNMLILVGSVKMADRVVREMMGL